MQDEWARIEYPHGKGGRPQDPTHYILDLKMEELADLLWLGGVIARHGSAEFRAAWGFLQPACVHYLFNFVSRERDMNEAAESLRSYANLVEELVKAGKVCSWHKVGCIVVLAGCR
jgi:hypothetical protein